MRNFFIITFIISICLASFRIASVNINIELSPDTVITNNTTVNHYDTINKINNDITEDGYNYTFKKEEITENISEFKVEYINTINEYISNKDYTLAKEYLDEFYYLFTEDEQVNSIKNYILDTIYQGNLVEYSGAIDILSFNPLISYPKLVLNEKNSSALKLDENNITIDEFKKILLSLYEKNYMLVTLSSVDFKGTQPKIMIPKGKKPLVLILEDVCYNTKANGCVEKLILDNNDNIATYTPKRAINDRIEHDNDFITILENFTNSHPSFSFNGAKALIVVDGSKGIFGYNTQKSNATSKYQIKKALEIINHLKTKGYTFASEGYGSTIKDPYISFASGLNSWENELEPLLEQTSNIFLLNSTLEDDNEFLTKLGLLSSYNYKIIIGSEMTNKCKVINDLTYITAKQVNGKTLRYCQDSFSHLFDCEYVYDHINRHITYNA